MVKRHSNKPLPIFQPSLQISFHNRLQTIRHSYLGEALGSTVSGLDISRIDDELARHITQESLAKLASFGLRGEIFFPVPYLLNARPSLLGYYRLLYGLSQKEFYRHPQISKFKTLEEKNAITPSTENTLVNLCESLIGTAQIMLEEFDDINLQMIRDLQMLTLGAQLRGGQNTKLGKAATAEVFSIIEKLIHDSIIAEDTRQLVLENAAGRRINITFSSDPDITIVDETAPSSRPLISIEIKGGIDVSNIHNRIGEAEKSHQKARAKGFFEFWTILGAPVNLNTAKRESPTTSHFFYLPNLQKSRSTEYHNFRNLLQSVLGLRTI